MIKVAVIGAGLAGLTVANHLKNYADVTVFEKSRGVGGRIATRRATPYDFDHGAQFFKVKTEEFKAFIKPMLETGIIKEWHARFVEIRKQDIFHKSVWDENNVHYVGVPGMNAMAKYLSKDLDIRLNKNVMSIKQNDAWQIIDDQGESLGNFEWVITTIPAEQSLKLIPTSFAHYEYISSVKMSGCYSLMLGFDEPLPLDFDAALVKDADISWVSVNSSKPGRSDKFCLLVHSTNSWADSQLDEDQQHVMNYLVNHTSNIIKHDVTIASHKALHRWRYANIKKQVGKKFLIDHKEKLAVCGDWFIQGKVESAFTSALKLSEQLIKDIKQKA